MLYKALHKESMRWVISILATTLYAISMNLIVTPMGMFTGGLLGMCQIIRTLVENYITIPGGIDLSGILYFLVNIPIFLIAWRELGKGFLLRTLVCTALVSTLLSIIPAPAAPILQDRLTASVVGGMASGFTLGLMLTSGSSSGGLDVVGLWLSKKGTNFTVGKCSLTFNACLYILCAILFDLTTAIYSVIYTAFLAMSLDRIHQQNIAMQMLIFTHDENPELPRNIMQRLGRGVTYWEGTGAYTGKDVRVLCVCISKYEEAELREIVTTIDPHAFFVVQEGVRIGGNFVRKLS